LVESDWQARIITEAELATGTSFRRLLLHRHNSRPIPIYRLQCRVFRFSNFALADLKNAFGLTGSPSQRST
jgi:hypothetical protein